MHVIVIDTSCADWNSVNDQNSTFSAIIYSLQIFDGVYYRFSERASSHSCCDWGIDYLIVQAEWPILQHQDITVMAYGDYGDNSKYK